MIITTWLALLLVPALIIGLIVWVGITLRAANRNDGRAEHPHDRYQDREPMIVNTGRGVLKVIAIVAVIALALLAILFGTCISATQW
ncbi:MAG: hypothetical protein WCJ55_11255 [Chloroflexales bacterium]